MKIHDVITFLESIAHPSLQESYDNAGLITGDPAQTCTGVICSLDATEDVIREAAEKNCNMVIAHHPIVFSGLKKLTGSNYVEKTVVTAIKHDIAIYAIHTNLDNIHTGVNGKIAAMIGLQNLTILAPRVNTLRKLITFIPAAQASDVRQAIFETGAGQIGQYSECSFNADGTGTFKPGAGTKPFAGKQGVQHHEPETRIEIVFPSWLEKPVIVAMKKAHPYEEVAFDIIPLSNTHPGIGAGAIGELPEPMEESAFLAKLKQVFQVPVIRHTRLLNRPVKKVAVCGGAGSFLVSKALAAKADIFVSADFKYHEFFDANDRMIIADIGHYESEQFTISLLQELLAQKFPTFAVLKTGIRTNPVWYS